MPNLRKTLRVLLTFYKNFALVSILITVYMLDDFSEDGFKKFQLIVFTKIVTSVVIYFFVNAYKANEMHYYYNLGFTKRFLWCTTLGFDFFLLVISLYVIYRLQ